MLKWIGFSAVIVLLHGMDFSGSWFGSLAGFASVDASVLGSSYRLQEVNKIIRNL
jgi:hypothetical protein